ncbi:transcriptional regulator [Trinickia terrae]|uniref:Transcriptional regulator n=1 Tax=Trinickia terrae TaxID=2571161 RepID=A0A4U1HSR4_9BURK|nr:Bro-N domain-containing protein [Trinickia terrae]TKC83443.1 transcriptional regulator [Trinickia terrae]
MQQASSTAVLVFESVEFDVVDIHGVPWLRAPQIEAALDYEKRGSINTLHDRNADEFTDEMTQLVELDTAGGRQQVCIFSPRGCYLLGMLARTERAKAFRAWVLDVLEGRLVPQSIGRLTVSQRLTALRYRGTLAKEIAKSTERGVAAELYANLRDVSRLLGMPVSPLEAIAPALKQQLLIN